MHKLLSTLCLLFDLAHIWLHYHFTMHFNSTGYGIHIFVGTSTPSSIDLAGSLPNNGLVIVYPTGNSFGRFLRIFCRSDSMMDNVGDIIGLDGTVISSGRFAIERAQPGEITMENSVTQGPLPSNEQGVYTCRIPDSTDTMRNINIGIYIAGFNSKLHKCKVIYLISIYNDYILLITSAKSIVRVH